MSVAHIRQLLQVKQTEIQDRLNQDKERLQQVKVWLDKICNEGTMPTVDIHKKEVSALRVISKREIGTYAETPEKLKEELLQQLNKPENKESVSITGPMMMLAYDEEYKEKDADIEMAFPIIGEITVKEPSVIVKTLPKCWVVSGIHKGSYHNLDKTYMQIFKYFERQHLTFVTPVRELYFNRLEEVPEYDLLTEIQCPFKQ